MAPRRQKPQHTRRIGRVVRLAEDVIVRDDGGVGCEHDAVARVSKNGARLGVRHTPHVLFGRFADVDGFIDVCGLDVEFESRGTQQLGAPRRRRREQKRHNVKR